MRLYFTWVIMALSIIPLRSQHLEVEGNVKMDLERVENSDSIVVKLPDGTLGIISRNAILQNIPTPIGSQDATTKSYVDGLITDVLNSLARDNEVFTSPSTGTVTDGEDNTYSIIRLTPAESTNNVNNSRSVAPQNFGSQWWMIDNLRATKYNDGTPVPKVESDGEWNGLTTSGFCWYNNDSLSYAVDYGALYNYYAVADTNSKNVCPLGWHVPSTDEWQTLFDYVDPDRVPMGFFESEIAGGKLKESGETHWLAPNLATNETGFRAVAGGARDSNGSFFSLGTLGRFLSTTSRSSEYCDIHYMVNNATWLARSYGYLKGIGYSVRCLRD